MRISLLGCLAVFCSTLVPWEKSSGLRGKGQTFSEKQRSEESLISAMEVTVLPDWSIDPRPGQSGDGDRLDARLAY